MEVVDGVYTLPLTVEMGDDERTFTPTVLESRQGLVLLDVGLPDRVADLEHALSEHDFSLTDLHLVVVTHHDGDHAGCLADLRDRVDVTTFAHRIEAAHVDGRKVPLKGDGERYPPADVDVELVDGVCFTTDCGPLEVVETFGHTPGHCSLYLPDEKLLVAGDALTSDGETLQGPPEGYTLDEDRAMESVARLAELDIEHTICYHGGYVEAGTDRIRELVEAYE
jgi:glyoxylase-like metal-dependent hydrolase (beta-lactamase superfamily II)